MADGEKLGGVILLLIYLAVVPLWGSAILNWCGGLLGLTFSAAMRQTVWFYLLFAATAVVFHHFLFDGAGNITAAPVRGAKALGAGLVAFYGLNELLFRLSHLLWGNTLNLNDSALINLDLLNAAPAATILAIVLLAPFVEEVLFRGFLFGWLRQHSRVAAYLITCILFALLHTWQSMGDHISLQWFFLAAQYAVPGAVLSWVYDRSDSIWVCIALHAAVNLLAVWTFYW